MVPPDSLSLSLGRSVALSAPLNGVAERLMQLAGPPFGGPWFRTGRTLAAPPDETGARAERFSKMA